MENRYWIGNSGDIEDTAHWSLTSGGEGGASAPTTSEYTAIFDTNSATEDYIEINISSEINCHIDMTLFNQISLWVRLNGSLSLLEDLDILELRIDEGVILLNNHNISVQYSSFNWTGTFELGASVIDLGGSAGGVFSGGTLSGGFLISNYGEDIVAAYTTFINCSASGSTNFIASVSDGNVDGGGNTGWDFSSTTIPFTISQSTGTVDIENCTLCNSHAEGGATFNAFTENGNVDGWGNEGWIFDGAPASIDRYWVGNTGFWNDTDHWSLTSGGVGGASVPSDNDIVIIDENSFTLSGQFIKFPASMGD
jgi:hypothetical protein